ncbi:MAG: phage tail tape measure protein, partial [Methanoregula sp.]
MPDNQQEFIFTVKAQDFNVKETIALVKDYVREINLAQRQVEQINSLQTATGRVGMFPGSSYERQGSGVLVGGPSNYTTAQRQMIERAQQKLLTYTPPTTPKRPPDMQYGFNPSLFPWTTASTKPDITSFETIGQAEKKLQNTNVDLISSFKNLSKVSGKSGIDMGGLAIRAAAVIPVWLALRSAYMTFINGIGEGIKFLVEFESAMAQIKIVGKGTEEEYNRLGDTVIAFSSTYGIAANEALKASKIFAQQGLKINEVINMTRTAMIGSIVLGEDIGKVAEDLTSAIRAYNISMGESLTVVDKWMKVQKEFAVTSVDLAEATKKAGATASSFGISYDKFLGDVTAIIEVTRKTGSEAGNALQMMYTRLFTTGAKAVQEIAKVPIYQDAAGKATLQNTNIYRNAGDVIDDLAVSFATLSESEKIELATKIGSRRQATPFIALMNNYNRSIEAQIASLTSAGDALSSFNILQDTTKVKTVQMQNTWSVLAKTVGDTNTFKFAIDSVKNLAEGLIYLANATEYAALKMRQKKQADIDDTSLNISRLETLKKLSELELKIANNPTEKNKKLLTTIKSSREAILATNPELATMDVKSEQYKNIRREIERDRASEIQQLRAAEILETTGPSAFILKGWSQQKAKNALIKKYGSVSKASKEILGGIEKEVQARLATQNISGFLGEVEENKIENKVDEELRKYKEIGEEVQHRANLMKDVGYSEQQILEYQIKQYETNEVLTRSIDSQNKLRQLRYDLEKNISGEIKKQSDLLETAAASTFKDILSGKGGNVFTSITNAMGESFRTTVSEGMAKFLIRDTGFGEFFGETMQGLTGQVESGHKIVYDLIKRGHIDGANAIRTTKGATTAAWSGSAGYAG